MTLPPRGAAPLPPEFSGAPLPPAYPGAPLPPPAPSGPTELAPEAPPAAPGDGWHRLHPATPLLRGGIAFVAILGILIVNLREVFIQFVLAQFVPDEGHDLSGEPINQLTRSGWLPLILLGIVLVVALCVGAFWLSWRMHAYRITDEVVEVRSGILFRSHRRARLDRVQGVNIVRPVFARLFGAARLEISVAGSGANTSLAYLRSAIADQLRREILDRASGATVDVATSVGETPVAAGGIGSVVTRRIDEFAAPELDPVAERARSVVPMHTGRLVGSVVLGDWGVTTFFVILGIIAVGIITAVTGNVEVLGALFALIPMLIAFVGIMIRQVVRYLRYTIADTPDGIRLGYGLLSTTNETLPPGRVHALMVSQPLLWRPFGWWQIQSNQAAPATDTSSGTAANTTLLPIGSIDDVRAVISLALPGVIPELGTSPAIPSLDLALTGTGAEGGFVTTPRRGRVMRWFSWRRNGIAIVPGAVLLRTGAIWRALTIVPAARAQSIGWGQGPLGRSLRLATLTVHTVAGAITPRMGALDEGESQERFQMLARAAVDAANADRSHRWRESVGEPGA